jgi:hypothetical protein
VTPGSVTGPLNVKLTRLSSVCAFAGAVASASKVTAQTKRTIVLSMYGLLERCGGIDVPRCPTGRISNDRTSEGLTETHF